MSDQTKFRLDEIKEIRNYFNSEIDKRKLCSKKLSKYVSTFNYIDKILIILNARTGGVCIISNATLVGAPVGIASTGFTIVFGLTTGIIKRLLKTTRNKKKKHNKVLMLDKSKLNNIESLVYQPLIDMKISHDKFITVFKQKDKYKKNEMKYEEFEWKIRRKTRKYENKYGELIALENYG